MTISAVNSADTLGQRIRKVSATLATGERAVVEYLQHHPDEAVISSAAKLGEVTGTSDATVIRTARKLGFEGLSDLKPSLVEYLSRRRDPAQVLDVRVQRLRAEERGTLRPVIQAGCNLLNDVPELINPDTWARAISMLDRTRHVWAYGIGPGAAVADLFALSLQRIGRPADAWSATGFRLADEVLRLTEDAVVVVIAPLRVFRETGIVLDHARSVGAKSIMLTEAVAEARDTSADIVLPLPDSTEGAANEILAPLMILHALVLELVSAKRTSAIKHYHELNALRSAIAGTELDVSHLPEM